MPPTLSASFLQARIAWGALVSNSLSAFCTASSSCSGGTTACTRPSVCARAALKRSPVTNSDQSHAAAHRRSIDACHYRAGTVVDRIEQVGQAQRILQVLLLGEGDCLLHRVDVGARAERRPLPGEHNGMQPLIGTKFGECRHQVLQDHGIEGVMDLRATQGNCSDTVLKAIFNGDMCKCCHSSSSYILRSLLYIFRASAGA